MEPIKQALEMARRERLTHPGGQQAPVRSVAKPVAETTITYTHTRKIAVPHAVLQRHRVIAASDNNAIADAYKLLRTQVLMRMSSKGWNALAITSPAQGQGKTLTAVNLAINMAREVNHTVLLVDLDLRRPQVHRLFGVEPEMGLSDYLQHDIELREVLFTPGMERLVILPGGQALSHSSEMLLSPKMSGLAEELKSRYPDRLVLFDLPPLLSTDDVLAFLPRVDAVLLVVQEGKTKRDEVTRSLEVLQQANLLGTVLNNSSQAENGHYYY